MFAIIFSSTGSNGLVCAPASVFEDRPWHHHRIRLVTCRDPQKNPKAHAAILSELGERRSVRLTARRCLVLVQMER